MELAVDVGAIVVLFWRVMVLREEWGLREVKCRLKQETNGERAGQLTMNTVAVPVT